MNYEKWIISDVFLKHRYYSPFLLPKTILIFGLFRIFVHGYKSVSYTHLTLPTKRIV
mgnify:CR=1 FL=1